MQILLFVTMLLLMMSLATTTRFNLFLLSSGLRHAYTRYIQQDFFDFYNKKQRGKYEDSSDKPASGGKAAPVSRPPAPAPTAASKFVSRINVQPLFNPTATPTPKAQEYAEHVKALLIRFIEIHYSKETPFKEAFKHLSVEQFVNDMIEGSRLPICGQPIRTKADVSGIPFHTRSTRELFYWMMIGGGMEKRYPSLLDYFAWNPQPAPINVYSAPEAILRAIYRDNTQQVTMLLAARKDLNAQINQTESSEELRQEKAKTWAALYNMEILTGFPESFLDFSIPKSDPGEG